MYINNSIFRHFIRITAFACSANQARFVYISVSSFYVQLYLYEDVHSIALFCENKKTVNLIIKAFITVGQKFSPIQFRLWFDYDFVYVSNYGLVERSIYGKLLTS